MRWKRKVILQKMETTYGVDSSPAGANAILATNIELKPLEAATVERENSRLGPGSYPHIHVDEHVSLSFDVEMAGAGSAGGIPAYGPSLRSCALAQTNTPIVDTQYDPVSDGEEAATIYIPWDGQLHKMLGCRGAWSIRLGKSGIPYWHFEMLGLYASAVSLADPTPDFSAFQTPVHVSKTNTPTVTLHGQALKLSSLEIQSGNEVIYRNLTNVEEIAVLDHMMTGKVVFEAPDISAWNVFETARANTLGAFQLVHGITAGHIVQLDAPQVQILNPAYTNEDKMTMISADLVLVPPTVDDEFKATVK